jgi:hypothetical protein
MEQDAGRQELASYYRIGSMSMPLSDFREPPMSISLRRWPAVFLVVLCAASLQAEPTKSVGIQHVASSDGSQREKPKRDSMSYVANLRAKYGGRITFSSVRAQQIVESFRLDCRAADGRTLPLMNSMLAKLASLDSPKAWLVSRADNRDNNVRIWDQLVGPKGPLMDPVLVYEINSWNELHPIGTRLEAMLNACFGSYGPIWEMPPGR